MIFTRFGVFQRRGGQPTRSGERGRQTANLSRQMVQQHIRIELETLTTFVVCCRSSRNVNAVFHGYVIAVIKMAGKQAVEDNDSGSAIGTTFSAVKWIFVFLSLIFFFC